MKMNHNDALHILGLKMSTMMSLAHELLFKEQIKTAYRKACSKYHPDKNPAGLEMMKLINAAYAALDDIVNGTGVFDRSIQSEKEGSENYGHELNNAINAIINLGLTIEICGSWIWVSGDTKPHKDVLKEAGYKWAPIKNMWHFRPKEYKSFNRGKWDMDTIRLKHGSTIVKRKSFQQIENN